MWPNYAKTCLKFKVFTALTRDYVELIAISESKYVISDIVGIVMINAYDLALT